MNDAFENPPPVPDPSKAAQPPNPWLLAIRPKTLPASVVPVAVGSAVAFGEGKLALLPAGLALIGALLIQIASNLANDVFDFEKGADTAARLGPTRVTQAGLITPIAMKRALVGVIVAAMVVGLMLGAIGGWPVLWIGFFGLISAVAYTGGPYPLGYHGWGDFFVFLFFGLIAVAGTTYVQTLALSPIALIAGVPVGLLCTNILVVNNVRDVDTDRAAGKRTLVARFGRPFGVAEYAVNLGLSAVACLALVTLLRSPWPALPICSLPLGFRLWTSVRRLAGPALNPVLAETARYEMIFGGLLAAGIALAAVGR
ncbi:MAG: 1,4-dihydroxy-2-naphthoate polyprenyltransferase [Fimbriimonadaceae bacterium]|nr:1,4-dihydroxy-2-naphthoate polyprenyltransferase [Fimbriimonadaceae bacterium]